MPNGFPVTLTTERFVEIPDYAVVVQNAGKQIGIDITLNVEDQSAYYGRSTFGHSLVVDPWGRILAEGDTEPGIVMARIDPAEVAAARGRVPSLRHGRRFEIVEPLAEPVPFKAAGGER